MTTITPLRAPEEGETLEVAPGWAHVRGSGRAIRRMGIKLADLANFLDLYDVGVRNEALVRAAGNRAFVAVDIAGTTQYWTMGGTAPQLRVKAFSDIVFVTGCCLFSAPAVRMETVDGELYDMVGRAQTKDLTATVRSITCAPDLTAYELESCRRLIRTIVWLMAGLPSDGPKVHVVLDVPRTQYYLYALDGCLNGHITTRQALEWFDEVDARSTRVIQHCRELLTAMLGDRNVTIRESEELVHLAGWLRRRFTDDEVPPIEKVVTEQFNRGSKDRNWRMLQHRDLPEDVVTFNGRTYSAALLRESMPSGSNLPLAIEVDNASEGKIFEGVEGVIDTHPTEKINCLSILPMENPFALRRGEGDDGRVGLYQNDPGRQMVVRNEPGSPELWPDGTQISIEELLDQQYPVGEAPA